MSGRLGEELIRLLLTYLRAPKRPRLTGRCISADKQPDHIDSICLTTRCGNRQNSSQRAFTHPEFRRQLAATGRSTVVAPHLFQKVAVPGVCVAKRGDQCDPRRRKSSARCAVTAVRADSPPAWQHII